MGTGMRGFFCASGKVHFHGEESRNCLTSGKPRTDASASAMERPERNSGLQVKAQRRGHHIREELKLFPACTFHRVECCHRETVCCLRFPRAPV